MRRAPLLLVAAAAATVGLLAGCAPAAPAPTATVTTTVTASPSPSASSPSPSATPIASSSPTSSSVADGCRNDAAGIPAGADVATVPSVDGDAAGTDDRAFYAETGGFRYGFRTAAGGTYTLPDDLAGPGRHSGWAARLDAGGAPLVVVLDDGRTATLHVFQNCRFLTVDAAQGQPYTFALNGFGDAGTGVACNDRNGGTLLEGAQAVERADGRYDVRWTQIDVTVTGDTATARNGATETRYTGLAASDPRVRAANGSFCNDAPKVGTSGR